MAATVSNVTARATPHAPRWARFLARVKTGFFRAAETIEEARMREARREIECHLRALHGISAERDERCK
jgi:NADH pyrophosphatase NudC (nudix superfamily)